MIEALRLLATTLALLVGLAALGSGPAVALGRRAHPLLLAPLAGLAAAGCLLTSASALLDMRVAAFAVLAPATLASLAWAFVSRRQARAGTARLRGELAGPLALGAVGLVIALGPVALHGTSGPVGLNVYDAWTYVPAERWAQRETAYADPDPEVFRSDLTLAGGWVLERCGCRNGVISLGAASSELLGTGPDHVHLALLAALLALIPASIWLLARGIGLERRFALLAAAFGLSPAVTMLVADSVLGNLAGLALVPVVVGAGVVAIRGGERRELVLAALLFGGLISIYPEFVLPVLAIAMLGCAALILGGRRSPFLAAERNGVLGGAVAVTLGGAALAPVAVERTFHYVTTFFEQFSRGIPRYLSVDDIGSWLFGVQHLYELQRFGSLGALKTAVAILLPLALLAVVCLGILGEGRRGLLLVATPIAVAFLLAGYVYLHYDNCQYCLWKSLTFALPFLAIGLALGLREVGGGAGWLRALAWLSVAAGVLGIVRSNVELARATYESAALTGSGERGITEEIAGLPGAPRVLLEGAEATASGTWGPMELYYLARDIDPRDRSGGRPAVRLLFDPEPKTLLPVNPAAGFYYSPRYGYVVTTFPGVRDGRRTIARDGIYTLARRAAVDVSIVRTGWALDPSEGASATPWVQGPFELWISSPRSGPGALRLRLGGPLAGSSIAFAAGGRALRAVHRGSSVCVGVSLRRGRTVVRVSPDFGQGGPRRFPVLSAAGLAIPSQIDPRLRPTESDPIPAPPKLLTIEGLDVRADGCSAGGP